MNFQILRLIKASWIIMLCCWTGCSITKSKLQNLFDDCSLTQVWQAQIYKDPQLNNQQCNYQLSVVDSQNTETFLVVESQINGNKLLLILDSFSQPVLQIGNSEQQQSSQLFATSTNKELLALYFMLARLNKDQLKTLLNNCGFYVKEQKYGAEDLYIYHATQLLVTKNIRTIHDADDIIIENHKDQQRATMVFKGCE